MPVKASQRILILWGLRALQLSAWLLCFLLNIIFAFHHILIDSVEVHISLVGEVLKGSQVRVVFVDPGSVPYPYTPACDLCETELLVHRIRGACLHDRAHFGEECLAVHYICELLRPRGQNQVPAVK